MPEGPTILLMKDDLLKFEGKKVTDAKGSILSDKNMVIGKTLKQVKTFGKLTFLVFEKFSFRIHLLMYGSYSLFEKKHLKDTLRLALLFKNEEIYFYTCSVKIIHNEDLNKIDWEADIMSDDWNPVKAIGKMRQNPEMLICDALMDQDIFSGVGNIIKNEALFRAEIHPESKIKILTDNHLHKIILESRNYSFDFLTWKRTDELRKHFQVYHKEICPKCGEKIIRKDTGKGKRTSFFCTNDQLLFA